jgi:hypothetical protein
MKLSKKNKNCLFKKNVSRSCQGTTMVIATTNAAGAAVKMLLFSQPFGLVPTGCTQLLYFQKMLIFFQIIFFDNRNV